MVIKMTYALRDKRSKFGIRQICFWTITDKEFNNLPENKKDNWIKVSEERLRIIKKN